MTHVHQLILSLIFDDVREEKEMLKKVKNKIYF
jgi:hypothetical protein